MLKTKRLYTTRRLGLGTALNYFLLALLGFMTFFPLYNILVVSLTGPSKIAAADGLSIIPQDPSFATYLTLIQIPKVARVFSIASSLLLRVLSST
ncbi:hypothetical protein MASR2M78_29870 [Treponema sp.]